MGTTRSKVKKWCKLLESKENEEFWEENESAFDENENIFEKCPVYRRLKGKEIQSDAKKDVWHFSEYFHGDEKNKPICASRNCRKFNRLTEGDSEMDLRHTLLFRHPLRSEGSMLKNMGKLNPIIFYTYDEESLRVLADIAPPVQTLNYLLELINEVIRNGFIEDLLCKGPKDPRIALKNLEASQIEYFQIMEVVRNKMKHPRHEEMGHPLKNDPQCMLAIILYTGGRCNYDLCDSQRKRDYKKWKTFDFCLDKAIKALSKFETFGYPLFSGLENVEFPGDIPVATGYFATYLSTSKNRHVAITFRGKKGLLLEIERGFKRSLVSSRTVTMDPCADVSWIWHKLSSSFGKHTHRLRSALSSYAQFVPYRNSRKKWRFFFDGAETSHGKQK